MNDSQAPPPGFDSWPPWAKFFWALLNNKTPYRRAMGALGMVLVTAILGIAVAVHVKIDAPLWEKIAFPSGGTAVTVTVMVRRHRRRLAGKGAPPAALPEKPAEKSGGGTSAPGEN